MYPVKLKDTLFIPIRPVQSRKETEICSVLAKKIPLVEKIPLHHSCQLLLDENIFTSQKYPYVTARRYPLLEKMALNDHSYWRKHQKISGGNYHYRFSSLLLEGTRGYEEENMPPNPAFSRRPCQRKQ